MEALIILGAFALGVLVGVLLTYRVRTYANKSDLKSERTVRPLRKSALYRLTHPDSSGLSSFLVDEESNTCSGANNALEESNRRMKNVLKKINDSPLMMDSQWHLPPNMFKDQLLVIRSEICDLLQESRLDEQQSSDHTGDTEAPGGTEALLRVKHSFLRVVRIFFMANYFTLAIAISAGLSMQLLFVTFTGEEGGSPERTYVRVCNALAFIALPGVIMFSSLVVHMAFCLLVDACRVPGFCRCRATLLMLLKRIMTENTNDKELQNWCAAIDVYFVDFFCLACLAGSLLGSSHVNWLVMAFFSVVLPIPIIFVIRALCSDGKVLAWKDGRHRTLPMITLCLLLLAKWLVLNNEPSISTPDIASDAWAGVFMGGLSWIHGLVVLYCIGRIRAHVCEEEDKVKNLRDLLRICWIEPGSMTGKSSFQYIKEGWMAGWCQPPKMSFRERLLSYMSLPVYLLGGSCFWGIIVLVLSHFHDKPWANIGYLFVVLPTLILLLYGWSSELVFRRTRIKALLSPYSIWVAISVALLTIGFGVGQFTNSSVPASTETLMRMGTGPPDITGPPPGLNPYPACKISWGSPTAPVKVLDLAALSAYAYMSDESAYNKSLNQTFGDRAVLERWSHYKTFPRVIVTRFPSQTIGGSDTVVLAVKGTSSAVDFFTDASFYAMVTVMQLATYVVDLLDFVPNTMVKGFISFFKLSWLAEHWIFDSIQHVVNQIPKGNFSIVFTGHSLGGGLASAIGARMNYSTVVFSAPGGHFSRGRLGRCTREQMYRNVLNVVPDMDWVTKVDRQDATIQKILCMRKHGDSFSTPGFPACHLMHNTICELWRACGDQPHGRNFGFCNFTEADRFQYLEHEN